MRDTTKIERAIVAGYDNESKGCVECHAAAGGDRLDPQERMPQRRVTRTYTTNRQSDPTAGYELECGHHTIDL